MWWEWKIGLGEASSNGYFSLSLSQSRAGSLTLSGVYFSLELSHSWEWEWEPGKGELFMPYWPPWEVLGGSTCHHKVFGLTGAILSNSRWIDWHWFFPFCAVCPPGPGRSQRPPGTRENCEDLWLWPGQRYYARFQLRVERQRMCSPLSFGMLALPHLIFWIQVLLLAIWVPVFSTWSPWDSWRAPGSREEKHGSAACCLGVSTSS